jgi:diaminopimelate epimerase
MDAGMPLSLFGSVLSTGSTHTVIPTAAIPDDETFASVSAKIEVDPKFPERTSVIWVQRVALKHIKIRIWERGVGETQGCGTGSSAAAVDLLRRTGDGGTVQVDNPGGTVWVSAEAWNRELTIRGMATTVFAGHI